MSVVVERRAPETAMDLGANAGYFSIRLGRRGVRTLAVDYESGTLRTGTMAIKRSGLDNVALMKRGSATTWSASARGRASSTWGSTTRSPARRGSSLQRNLFAVIREAR